MKLNIQLFAVTATTTFNEPALTADNIANNKSTLKITIYFDAGNNITYFTNKKLWCKYTEILNNITNIFKKTGNICFL